jgi:hypothetical protein
MVDSFRVLSLADDSEIREKPVCILEYICNELLFVRCVEGIISIQDDENQFVILDQAVRTQEK